MATVAECESALASLAGRLAEVDPELRRKHAPDRTLACTVPDLDVVFTGRLHDGELRSVSTHPRDASPDPRARAQLRLTVGSDDLVALTEGRLALPLAWASGRLKVEASVRDLLRVRTWL